MTGGHRKHQKDQKSLELLIPKVVTTSSVSVPLLDLGLVGFQWLSRTFWAQNYFERSKCEKIMKSNVLSSLLHFKKKDIKFKNHSL